MKSRPIIMSGESVQAICNIYKTMTWRPIKHEWMRHWTAVKRHPNTGWMATDGDPEFFREISDEGFKCPYGEIGDELWVRETYVIEDTYNYYDSTYNLPKYRPVKKVKDSEGDEYYLIPHYRATEPEPHIVPEDREDEHDDTTRWRPSIFMPRWASRITLKITDIKVERLRDITYEEGIKEGIKLEWTLQKFQESWNKYNKEPEYQWNANPWVWVIEFKKLKGEL